MNSREGRESVHGVIGWDIGGVNTKVARVVDGQLQAVRGRPYEIQRAPDALVSLLVELAAEVGFRAGDAHAVTMTAELSQLFRTKREGVRFVIDAVQAAFPSSTIEVYRVDGCFCTPEEARAQPLAVAAANWSATAHLVARHHPDAVLIDIGSTSTDIIPIVGGEVVAQGLTDPDRLLSGELVYTGALRTPAEAMASHVPLGSGMAGASAESFALAGDVHVWRGDLAPSDYTVATPDGRPPTREFARERLARVVCGDRDMLDDGAVSAIADALAAAQIERIAEALTRVVARHSTLRTAVVTGLGAFLGEAAARAAGLDAVPLSGELGDAGARCAPAASVALLLDARGTRGRSGSESGVRSQVTVAGAESLDGENAPQRDTVPDFVVKIGGGALAQPHHLDAALAVVAAAAARRPLLLVTGGGPFADAVRDVDARIGLSADASHWMAVSAMDQYAHLIADRLPGAALVATTAEIAAALAAGRVPVLQPSRWLREADPLPHTWDVTSDSIAAWVAGVLGARDLLLVKPAGVHLPSSEPATLWAGEVPGDLAPLVDAHFACALPSDVTVHLVAADDVEGIERVLRA